MASTARLEVRIRPVDKARLERAAALEHVPVSEFVRSAVEDRTERVLMDHESRTAVPAQFFDDLLSALDSPGTANVALSVAAQRARDLSAG
jgi:uncharacterized protein (DUF1778 family)